MRININGDPITKLDSWLSEKATEAVYSGFAQMGDAIWKWFINVLPDLIGYGALFTGVTVILGGVLGNGQMIKHLGIYAICVIIAICLLGGLQT